MTAKFDEAGLIDHGRLATYRSTLRMIADDPWFGSGLGTFPWGYPAYRGDEISMRWIWNRAHNTPLEIAAELGLPLASLIGAGWIIALAVLVRGIIVRQRDRIISVAAFSVSALELLHCAVDFSLQIPGCAIVVFLLLGAGIAQSFSRNQTAAERIVQQ